MSEETAKTTERKARTVSTAYLEKIRNHKQVSVGRFLQDILEYQNENPSDTFQEAITNYSKENKIKGSGKSSSANDPNKQIIKTIFNKGLSPIKGTYVNSSVSRRKDHQDGDFYSVNLVQDTGVKSKVYVDMTNTNAIIVEVNGIMFDPISFEEETGRISESIVEKQVIANANDPVDEFNMEEEEEEVYHPHLD